MQCVKCPVNCAQVRVSCSDAISVVIQSILNLAQTHGSLAIDITSESKVICPDITDNAVLTALNTGCSKGIFTRYYATRNVEPTFMVNAYMTNLNYQNCPYNRPPCRPGSFFNSSV